MNFIFLLFILVSPNDASLLRKIIKRTFRDGDNVCLIWELTKFSNDLLIPDTGLSTVSIKNLNSFDGFCNGYIVAVKQGDSFISLLEIKYSYKFQFKPLSRILLLYEEDVSELTKLHTAVNLGALDVMTIKFSYKNVTCLLDSAYRRNIIVTSVYKNKTLLTRSDNKLSVDWYNFKPYKWQPKLPANYSFKITLFECPPYVFTTGKAVDGLEISVLNEVLKGFPVDFISAENASDPWQFTFDTVVNNQSDFGVCSPWVSSASERNVDMTSHLTQVCVTFLVRKPKMLPSTFFIFYPLPNVIYLMLFATLIITTLFDKILAKLFPNKISSNVHAGNLLLLFLLFFSLLVQTYYSAGLTSALQNPPLGKSVSTLHEMVEDKLPWTVLSGEISNIYERQQTEVSKALAKTATPFSIASKLKRVAIFAKILERIYLCDIGHLSQEVLTRYRALKDCLNSEFTVLVLQRHSPLLKVTNDVVVRMTESGILSQKLKQIIDRDRQIHERFFTNFAESYEALYITFKELTGTFILLHIGLVLSFVLFLMELLVYRISNRARIM